MDNERMLTLKEVKHIMRLSESSIYRLRLKKEPPFDSAVKLGRRVVFPPSVFAELISPNCTQFKADQNG